MATILYTSTWGTDDPTRATLPFLSALGAVEAGHQAEIALLFGTCCLRSLNTASRSTSEGAVPRPVRSQTKIWKARMPRGGRPRVSPRQKSPLTEWSASRSRR
jgi:hypothetical protein